MKLVQVNWQGTFLVPLRDQVVKSLKYGSKNMQQYQVHLMIPCTNFLTNIFCNVIKS